VSAALGTDAGAGRATGDAAASAAADLARARSLIESARFEQAEVLLQALVDQVEDAAEQTEALYLLAVTQRYGGAPARALESLQRLLEIQPDHPRAHQELGHGRFALGHMAQAERAYTRAVGLNPGLKASWRKLLELRRDAGQEKPALVAERQLEFLERLPPELLAVTNLIYEGELHKAEQVCREFLQQHKHHIEAMRLLAEIALRLGIYDDAEFLLESCVELAPDYRPARIDYLNLLIRKTRFAAALEQINVVLAEQPNHPGLRTSLGTTLVGLGRFDDGIAAYQQVLTEYPDNWQVWLLLGHAQKTVGDFSAAIASYQRAYSERPDFGDAYWSLANTKTYRFSDAELEQIESYRQQASTGVDDRIHLCFAAGKAREDRGDFSAAFAHYQQGNALKKRQVRYDPAQIERRVEAQMQTCTAELFARRAGSGCPRPDPIFIVGMPRAGSTLLEQILASHSMVDGTMELHEILALAQRLRGRTAERTGRYPAILQDIDDEYLRQFGERYLESTRVYRGDAAFFTDKMPNNFLHVGLIRLILPNARIIDARRDPMACCFSNFKQLFGEGQEFSYGLHEVGRYYQAYVRLMDHWDQVLPGFVLRVMHEDVVDDLEAQVRRILAFCGLPFEAACLRFHDTERDIRTPSSEQVRQPIYRSGLDQWRNFEAFLSPLEDALGADILARYPPR
jgi:tetratricopeptide (TPR) repeat protein